MTEICIEVSPNEQEEIRKYLCRNGETPSSAIKRIVMAELKAKNLMADLKYRGEN